MPSWGSRAGTLGLGQECAGPCCVEAVCAAALGGAMEDAAAADAQGDFPSWWHHYACCWRGDSSGAGGCVSSGGSWGCLSLASAFLQGPEPWGRELRLLPLSIQALSWR